MEAEIFTRLISAIKRCEAKYYPDGKRFLLMINLSLVSDFFSTLKGLYLEVEAYLSAYHNSAALWFDTPKFTIEQLKEIKSNATI